MCLQASTAARLDNQTDHFVQVVGGEFVVGCKKFYVSGWNQWEVVEAAAGALELFGASLPEGKTGPQVGHSLPLRHGCCTRLSCGGPLPAGSQVAEAAQVLPSNFTSTPGHEALSHGTALIS